MLRLALLWGAKKAGTAGWIRTADLRIHNPAL